MKRHNTIHPASETLEQDMPATSTPKPAWPVTQNAFIRQGRWPSNSLFYRVIAVATGRCFGFLCAFLAAAGFLASSAAWADTLGVSVKKSLVIGIDGMGFGEQGFSVATTPWMDSLIAGTWMSGYQGAYSDQAFAGGVLGTPTQQSTVSGPGWSTILTGVWRDEHNVNDNGNSFTNGFFANSPRSGLPSNLPYLGSLEEAVSNIYTASYVWWDPIDTFIISSLDFDGNPNNDLDFHAAYGFDPFVAAESSASISNLNDVDPAAVFVSFDLVDGAGHSCGSSGLCFREAIETADGYVGDLLAAIANRGNFGNEDWQIVITADHGHRTFGGHGGQSNLERRIPFIVASQKPSNRASCTQTRMALPSLTRTLLRPCWTISESHSRLTTGGLREPPVRSTPNPHHPQRQRLPSMTPPPHRGTDLARWPSTATTSSSVLRGMTPTERVSVRLICSMR